MHKVPGIKLVVSSPQSNGTIDSDKSVSAQHTRAILSIGARDSPGFAFTNSVGNRFCRRDYILSVFLKRGGNMQFHGSVIFTSRENVKIQEI